MMSRAIIIRHLAGISHLTCSCRAAFLAAFALLSCSDASPTRPSVATDISGAAKSIAVTTVDEGPHFRFLPPIGIGDIARDGVFDPDLEPDVVICPLEEGVCDANRTQRYSQTGLASERVRVSNDDECYVVNWRVPESQNSGTTYRIAVVVAGHRLGYAEVTVGEPKVVPVKFRIERGAVALAHVGIGATVPTAARSQLTNVRSQVASAPLAEGVVAMAALGELGLVVATNAAGTPFLLGYASAPLPTASAASVANGELDASTTAQVMLRMALVPVGDAGASVYGRVESHSRLRELEAVITAALEDGKSPIENEVVWSTTRGIAAEIIDAAYSTPQSLPFATPSLPLSDRGEIWDADHTNLGFRNRTFIYQDVEVRWSFSSSWTTVAPRGSLVDPLPSVTLQGTNGLSTVKTSAHLGPDAVIGPAPFLNFQRAVLVIGTGIIEFVTLRAGAGSPTWEALSCSIQKVLGLTEVAILVDAALTNGNVDYATEIIRGAILSAFHECVVSKVDKLWEGFVGGEPKPQNSVEKLLVLPKEIFFFKDWVTKRSTAEREICQVNGVLQSQVSDCQNLVKISCQGPLDDAGDNVGFILPGSRLRCYLIDLTTGLSVPAAWSRSFPAYFRLENAADGLGVDIVGIEKGIADVTARRVGGDGADAVTVYATDLSGNWVTSDGTIVFRDLLQSGSDVWGKIRPSTFGYPVGDLDFSGRMTACISAFGDALGCLEDGQSAEFRVDFNPVRRIGVEGFHWGTFFQGGNCFLLEDGAIFSCHIMPDLYPGQCPVSEIVRLTSGFGARASEWIPCIYGATAQLRRASPQNAGTGLQARK
jgi:hypothetical protein